MSHHHFWSSDFPVWEYANRRIPKTIGIGHNEFFFFSIQFVHILCSIAEEKLEACLKILLI